MTCEDESIAEMCRGNRRIAFVIFLLQTGFDAADSALVRNHTSAKGVATAAVSAAVAGHAFGGHFNGFIGKLVGIGVHRIGPLGENPFPEMIAELALESTTLDTQP